MIPGQDEICGEQVLFNLTRSIILQYAIQGKKYQVKHLIGSGSYFNKLMSCHTTFQIKFAFMYIINFRYIFIAMSNVETA